MTFRMAIVMHSSALLATALLFGLPSTTRGQAADFHKHFLKRTSTDKEGAWMFAQRQK